MPFIKLKVHPDSKRPAIAKMTENAYKVWVRAAAERGMANQEALNLLSKALGVEQKKLRIIKGSTTQNKIVMVM